MATGKVFKCLVGATPGFTVVVDGESPVPLSVLNQWASTTEGLRPDPGEWLLRAARFRHDDEVWTWLGYYRHAYQLGGSRPGGIAAAGLLVRDGYVQGGAAVSFLTEAEALLEGAAMKDGRFVMRLEDIAHFAWPYAEEGLPEAAVRRMDGPDLAGLDPDKPEKIYIDLSDPGESVLASWYFEWAQIGPALSSYSRLFIGNTTRLAETARDVSDVRAFTSREFASAPLPTIYREPEPAGVVEDDRSAEEDELHSTASPIDEPYSEPGIGYLAFPRQGGFAKAESDWPPQAGVEERLDDLRRFVKDLARRTPRSSGGAGGHWYRAVLLGAGSTFVGIVLLIALLALAGPAIEKLGTLLGKQSGIAATGEAGESEEINTIAGLARTGEVPPPDAAAAGTAGSFAPAPEIVQALFVAVAAGDLATAREQWSPSRPDADFQKFVAWRRDFTEMKVTAGTLKPLRSDGSILQVELPLEISGAWTNGRRVSGHGRILLRKSPQPDSRWFVGAVELDPGLSQPRF